VLYTLSAVTGFIDILGFANWSNTVVHNIKLPVYHREIAQVTVFAVYDFIAQSILIYRCWIIWGYRIRVVIVPLFLALAFLAIWIASGIAPLSILQDQVVSSPWGTTLETVGLSLSMTVNALVTGLIVFRIFKASQEVNNTTCTSDNRTSRVTRGSTLRRVIFILIESGMALFSIQVARLVVTIVFTDASYAGYFFIRGIHEMLNGITPAIILVRVSMGLSFHDESSMVEASIGSLHFEPRTDIPNSIPENGIIDEERRDDYFEIQSRDGSDI